MNDNQFMGLRISWWRMHEQHWAINSWGSRLIGVGCMNDNQFKGLRIRFDDGGCTSRVGNQFVGLRTQWWRMHKRKLIHGAPNKMVENA